jgi:hypothetical protein
MLLLGVLWMLQGANLFGSSFMTDEALWIYIGAAVAGAGIVVLVWANFRRD